MFIVVAASVVHIILFSHPRWLVSGQAQYIKSQRNLWLH